MAMPMVMCQAKCLFENFASKDKMWDIYTRANQRQSLQIWKGFVTSIETSALIVQKQVDGATS